MKRSIIIILFALLAASVAFAGNSGVWPAPHQLTAEKAIPIIDAKLTAAMTSMSPDVKTPVWVFFTDKGIDSDDAYNLALDTAERSLTQAARERRLKARGRDNLVDFRDLPVRSDYIDNVLSSGAKLRHILKWFNAVTVDATSRQIEDLAALECVRYVKAVATYTSDFNMDLAPIQPDMSLVSLNYGPSLGQLEQINAVVAHELGFNGQGVIICMMDTGFRQQHDAFQNIINSGRLIAQYDFINHDDNVDYEPNQDTNSQPGHGTLTWSTLGGEASGHLYGPSYGASFVLSKTEYVPTERHEEEDNWAAGALWADSIGASVISASLGYRWFDSGEGDYSYNDLDGNTTIVTIAADLAAYNGIAVATAMGNEGNTSGSLIAPADGDSVIACGAVDPNGNLAGFSSYGPTSDGRTKPEVCAQGVWTVCVDANDPHGYSTASGTSLSTPLVGGSCGILLSAHPNWTPMMVREALMMTADRADTPDNHYGWGIMDVGRALNYHPEGDVIFEHAPVLTARVNQPTDVSVTISGGLTISSAYIYYRSGNSGDFTELQMTGNGTYTATIPGQTGEGFQYYFKAMDDDGIYALYPLGGENNPYTVVPGINSLDDSFENGLLYWKSGGTNNTWGLTANDANSGNVSMSDSPTINYYDDTDSWIESNFSLDLSAGPASVSFYYMGNLQTDRDYLYLESSTDGGTTWNQVSTPITGNQLTFTQYEASLDDLIGYSDVRLRFHLTSDATGQRDGILLDDISINWTQTSIDDNSGTIPNSFTLSQNYPNPFNPSTEISFTIPVNGQVKLTVFDLLGRNVKTLISEELTAGSHEITWEGNDESGKNVASGIYLYKLETAGMNQVKMMTLIR